MAISHVATRLQRMRPFEVASVNPVFPTIEVKPSSPNIIEGETINVEISRIGTGQGQITFTYTFVSEGGSADFATSPTGTGVIESGEFTFEASVRTVQRTGVQNDRLVTCTVSNIVGAVLSSTFPFALTTVRDYAAPTPGGWHKALAYRSGRPFASGTSYWSRRGVDETFYNDNVAWIDGFNGPNFDEDKGRIQTWLKMCGGPKGNPNSIYSDGQLNWNSSSQWSTPFQAQPVNKCWMSWTMDILPMEASTEKDTTRRKGWDSINNGEYDQEFKDMGARIKKNCATRGVSMDWLLCRMNHENEQTNHHRVYPGTAIKAAWVSAADRVIDLVREGAGHNIRFFLSPGPWKNYEGVGNMGTLESWAPTNIDGISMSFHPNGEVTNRSSLISKFFQSNATRYGIEDDVLNLCQRKGWKVGFCEWSPTYTANKCADIVYQVFYDEYLTPYRNDIICDFVFDPRTIMLDGADYSDKQTDEGRAAWRRGVAVFKDKWKGKGPNWPNFTRSSWPASDGSNAGYP